MALLEADRVTKRFGGVTALAEVTLSADEGEIVGLIGPNGAGKTTLFNCLLGLARPDAGRVTFAGQDLGRTPVYRRSRLGLGRTFQRMELFAEMTVREHLVAATRARHGGLLLDLCNRGAPSAGERDRVEAILELLGIAGVGDRQVESLSLGYGRLVELGRALATEPRLLMLDEPSSGLDRTEAAELGYVLARVVRARGTGVVLVEHDLELVRSVTTRLYVLDVGQILASGPTAQVLDDPTVRAAYIGEAAGVDGPGSEAPAPKRLAARPEPPVGPAPVAPGSPALELADVHAGYGRFRAVFGVTLAVPAGSAVALLGPNGAGKSTVARVATGLVPVTTGRVRVGGQDVTGWRPHRLARLGATHVPEGGGVFATLTVEENLLLRFGCNRSRPDVKLAMDQAYDALPFLRQRRQQRAKSLSGGEQRLLSLASVLVDPPRLLVVDELSLGLAPRMIEDVYRSLAAIKAAGTALLIVEQHVARAFSLADYYVLLNQGEVVRHGLADDVRAVMDYRPEQPSEGNL